MSWPTIPLEVRRLAVDAYQSGKSPTYAATAALFGMGTATFMRILKRHREEGHVEARPRGGNRQRVVDDAWVEEHAKQFPDATLTERVAAWESRSGVTVSRQAMCNAMHRIGWTHKKRHPKPASATHPRSSSSDESSANSKSRSNRTV